MTVLSTHTDQVILALTEAERQVRSNIQELADELEQAIRDYETTYYTRVLVDMLDLEHLPGKHNQKTHGRTGIGTGKILAAKLRKDGGFTYRLFDRPKSPKTGFALSLHKDKEKIISASMPKEEAAKAVRDYAREHRATLRQEGMYIGGWHNPDDGNVYLDVVTVVKDRAEAIRLGNANDQISIYDLGKGETITLAEVSEHLGTKHDQKTHAGKGRGRVASKQVPKFGSAEEGEAWLKKEFPQTDWLLVRGDTKIELAAVQALAEDHVKLSEKFPAVSRNGIEQVELRYLGDNSASTNARWTGSEKEIALNTEYFAEGNYSTRLARITKDSEATAWHPPGTSDPRTVYVHEYGHAVNEYMDVSSVNTRIAVTRFLDAAPTPSRYSNRSSGEKFAEIFLDLYVHPTPYEKSGAAQMQKLFDEYADVLGS